MFRYADLSIRTKIASIILIGVSSAIIIALTSFILFDRYAIRKNLTEELTALAEITAARSDIAITFADQGMAEENLSELANLPHIQAACFYDVKRTLFAKFNRFENTPLRCAEQLLHTRNIIEDGRVVVTKGIRIQTEFSGYVTIISDTRKIEEKITYWVVLCGLAFVSSLLVVLFMTQRMQKAIVEPIVKLTNAMDTVRDTNELSVRAEPAGYDEVGKLVEAFNEMLGIMEHNATDLSIVYSELVDKSTEAEAIAVELEARNSQIKELLGGAAHDLRQPLQAMSIFIDCLQLEKLPEKHKDLVNKIQQTAENLNTMFTEILDFSRLDHKAGTAEYYTVDLQELLEKLSLEFEVIAKEKGLQLRKRIRNLTVHTVPAMLERIIRNLVSNAVRYTDAGGVLISTRMREGDVVIEVWDTGNGIPKEKQALIFNKFEKLDSIPGDRHGNYGLGLAIVQHFLRQLEYKLSIRSVAGCGSCFRIHIPAFFPAQEVAQQTPTNTPRLDYEHVVKALEQTTVYLIDDEDTTRDGLTLLLQSLGMNVLGFSGLGELSRYFDSGDFIDPDIIISDYQLDDDVTGDMAIDEARMMLGINVPAFIVTGAPDAILREINKKGFAYLRKPVRVSDLKDKINELTN